MNTTAHDPERIPVVVASGQSIERTELVTPVDLMARAAEEALAAAPGLRDRIDRLSVVDIMSRSGPAPASELAERLGTQPGALEVTTVGGNSPQWLVNRAASAIAGGTLSVTLIAGAESIRSGRARRAAGMPVEPGRTDLAPDPVVGDDLPGVGPAETAIGLWHPSTSTRCSRAWWRPGPGTTGPSTDRPWAVCSPRSPRWRRPTPTHGSVRPAPPTTSPPRHPTTVWCATPTPSACARTWGPTRGRPCWSAPWPPRERAGVADRAVFVWSGADATDVRFPTARPDPGRSPAIAAAGRAAFRGGSLAAGRGGVAPFGIDDIEVLDIYSCFPSAVELAAAALGIATDDARGLTVTGGLPYFGGPGNNYTTHGIGAVTDILRDPSARPGGPRGVAGVAGGGSGGSTGGSGLRLGMATGLGWFITKHSIGVYGSEPPPDGYHRGDTSEAQSEIDATAAEVALEVDEPTRASIVAVTVVRDDRGAATGAPLLALLPDGRRMALAPADDEVTAEVGQMDVPGLVGTTVVVEPGEARYRLPMG